MIEHPNVALVRTLFEAFQKGDILRRFAMIDESAVCEVLANQNSGVALFLGEWAAEWD